LASSEQSNRLIEWSLYGAQMITDAAFCLEIDYLTSVVIARPENELE